MKKKKEKHNNANNLPRIIFWGMIITGVFTIVFLAIISVLIIKGMISEDMGKEAAMAAVFAGVFIGTVAASKMNKHRPFLTGVIVGISFFLLRNIICIISEDGVAVNETGLGIMFCTCCGMLAGSLIGSQNKKRRRK